MTKRQAYKYLKDSKVYVESSEKSKLIRQKLEECGHVFNPQCVNEIESAPYFYIGIDKLGTITVNDIQQFEDNKLKLLKADDIISIDIVEDNKFKVGERVKTIIDGTPEVGKVVDCKFGIYTARADDGHEFDFYENDAKKYYGPSSDSELDSIVKEVTDRLEKRFPGQWYIGGSYGLKLLGYDLGRDINDFDFVVCGNEFITDPLALGTDAHELLYGDDWKWNKSHSFTRDDDNVRCVCTIKNGVKLDLFLKHQKFPDSILDDIIKEKKKIVDLDAGKLRRNNIIDERFQKHSNDLKKLKELGVKI